MLVHPKEAGGFAGKMTWRTVKENAFLMIQHYAFGVFGKVRTAWDGDYAKDYRILSKDERHWILAVSENEDEIMQAWDFLKVYLVDQLQAFDEQRAFRLLPDIARDLLVKQERVIKRGPEPLENVQHSALHEAHGPLQGWLWKKGRVVHNWKRRYFVQKGSRLYYFESETTADPKNFIDLSQVENVHQTSAKDIEIVLPNRVFNVQLVEGDERGARYWVEGLQEMHRRSPETYDLVGRCHKDLSEVTLEEVPDSLFVSAAAFRLEILLAQNNRVAQLPMEVHLLKSLTEVHLTNNAFTEFPEVLCRTLSLVEIHLSINQISSIPESISQLVNLEKLSIARNKLLSIPASIGQLTKLRILFLHENDITKIPPEIGSLTSLTHLTLYGNPPLNLPVPNEIVTGDALPRLLDQITSYRLLLKVGRTFEPNAEPKANS
eukprot:TRINITY_DN9007_c0_g1_i2.p1 TRINITY_DN9007_c0_g1~~TRINITY_DN9007_c0_g1_i2.p1  ORF type:complete len:451 (+),score=83.26 TRINITY_DN9007_c0_g1_i2:52-1353(+)